MCRELRHGLGTSIHRHEDNRLAEEGRNHTTSSKVGHKVHQADTRQVMQRRQEAGIGMRTNIQPGADGVGSPLRHSQAIRRGRGQSAAIAPEE